MVYTRNYKKRGRITRKRTYKKTYKKRGYRKAKISASSERLTFMVGRQLPLPPRYRTTMTVATYGRISAAGLDLTGQGRAYVFLNSPFLPFNNASWGLGGSGPFTINDQLPSVIKPAGFSRLCNIQMYQKFRVYASKITMTLAPSTGSDYVELALTPTESTSTPAKFYTAQSIPYTRSKLNLSGKGPVSISNYMSVHKLKGVTKSAIQNDLSGQFEGTYLADPATKLYWAINVATTSYNDNDAMIGWDIKVKYWVEFFDLGIEEFPIT